MRLVLQVLMIVILFFCDSHQLGRKGDGLTSALRQIRAAMPRGNGFSTGMGPYDVDVKIFRQCDDPGINLINLHLEAYNTKTNDGSKILYRGNFTVPFTKEQIQNLDTRVKVYRVKDKKEFLMLKYEDKVCVAFEGPAKDVYAKVKKEFNIEEGGECYFPQRFYSFNDWDIKAELPPPVMEYGNYRSTVELIHENQVFTCLEIIGVVKQKS